VNALIAHTKNLSMKFGENRPGIVHRIDKETSGLLVVAKNDFAHEGLALQFKERTIQRKYQAIVFGIPLKKTGTIESFLARHPTDRKRYASVLDAHKKKIIDAKAEVPFGKWAVTDFEVLKTHICGISLMQLKLQTGRTHQIRIHMSEMGHPIVADNLYGANKKLSSVKSKEMRMHLESVPRFALHAFELGFVHPRSGKNHFFTVDWPSDMNQILTVLDFKK
jgi:23S rRNA pseudouridine1911/1915/1917 synthase